MCRYFVHPFLVLLAFTVHSQAQGVDKSRKKLLTDIHSYRDSVVMAYTYKAPTDKLLADVEQVLTSQPYPFTVASRTKNEIIFSVYFAKISFSLGRTRRRGGASMHSTRWYLLLLTTIVDISDTRCKLSFKENTRSSNLGSRTTQFPNSPTYDDIWSELALRWKLYKKYSKDMAPPLPKSLIERVRNYNDDQRAERRKLIAGKHF